MSVRQKSLSTFSPTIQGPGRRYISVTAADAFNAIVTIGLELNIVKSLALSGRSLNPEEGMSPLLGVGLMLPIVTSLTSLIITKTYGTTEMRLAEAKCLAFGLHFENYLILP